MMAGLGIPLDTILCTACGQPLTYAAGGKVKMLVKSRVLAFTQDGQEAEMVCPHCRADTSLPIRFVLPLPIAPAPAGTKGA